MRRRRLDDEPTRLVEEAEASRDDRLGVEVQAPYDRSFVEALKALAPPHDREYDPHSKHWWFASMYLEQLKDLCVQHFGHVEVVDGDGVVDMISPGAVTRQERLF